MNDLKRTVPLGKEKTVRIGDRKFCLFHRDSGFTITDHLCPHNGFSLAGGTFNNSNEIVCPLHGYRFNLKDGKECQSRTPDLGIHQLSVKKDGVYLGIVE